MLLNVLFEYFQVPVPVLWRVLGSDPATCMRGSGGAEAAAPAEGGDRDATP